MPVVSQRPLSRRITAEEAFEGYLRVNKTWLRKLPEPDTPFNLKVGKENLKVRIQRRESPREHYVLTLPLVELEAGVQVTLRPVSEDKVVLEFAS